MATSGIKFFIDRVRISNATAGDCTTPFERAELRKYTQAPYKGHRQTRAAHKTFIGRNRILKRDSRRIYRIWGRTIALYKEFCAAKDNVSDHDDKMKGVAQPLNTGQVLYRRFQGAQQNGLGIEDTGIPGPSRSEHEAVASSAGRNGEQEANVGEPQIEERVATRSITNGTARYAPNLAINPVTTRMTKRRKRPTKTKGPNGATQAEIDEDFRLIELNKKELDRRQRLICAMNQLRKHGVRNNTAMLPLPQIPKEDPAPAPAPKPGPNQARREATRRNGKITLDLRVLKEKKAAHVSRQRLHQLPNGNQRLQTSDYVQNIKNEKQTPCLSFKKVEEIRCKTRGIGYNNFKPSDLAREIFTDARKALSGGKKEVERKERIAKMISKVEKYHRMGLKSEECFILSAVPVRLRAEASEAKVFSSGLRCW
jgi:hypothetical protein